AGRQVADITHLQLFGSERRGDIQPLAVLGQTKHVLLIAGRAEGGGEQCAAVGRGKTPAQKGRRKQVAQTQGGQLPPAGLATQADVEQRVIAEVLCEPTEQQSVQIEAQQRSVIALGLVGQVIGEGADQLLQAENEQIRQQRMDLIFLLLLTGKLIPVTVQPVQRTLQTVGCALAQGKKALLVQLGGIHAASALDQVVSLVH